MPLYNYKARDKKGKVIEDTIQAASREDAASSLKADGLAVLTVRDLETGLSSLRSGKVSLAEKASFCRFTATMLRAGLSLHEAVEIIKQESENKKMKKILADIAFQIRKGRSLSGVLSGYKDIFDPVFLTMIKAGEESGTLEQSLDYLAKQLSASYDFSQKIKGSLMYPAVIIGAMFAEGLLMLVFVLPKISEVFLKMNLKLPVTTRLLLQFGLFVSTHLILVLVAIFSLAGLAFLAIWLKSTRDMLFRLLAKIPVLKKMMSQIDVARFARTLSVLLKSGVPIIDALGIATDSLNQPDLRNQAKKFTAGVSKGKSLSEVLSQAQTSFPQIMIQTIKTGEKTGSLEQVLQELAEFYENEVDYQLKRVTSLIEPVLMLLIGIVVGAMVIMIIAPIYSIVGGLQESIKH